MTQVLTIVGKYDGGILTDKFASDIANLINAKSWEWLENKIALDFFEVKTDIAKIIELIGSLPLDYCLQDSENRRKKLLISDMDSTIIEQECIDEIAAYAGLGAQVANITEAAMNGQLDFSQSLIARVALLKDIEANLLEKVWNEKITFQTGAFELIKTMNKAGAFTMLVSGGFTFFTSKIAKELGFSAHFANELIIENGKLTGEVALPILDKSSKRELLLQQSTAQNIPLSQTIAVGDGANDADMIMASGLGVAYRAKPFLCSLADCAINHTDLRSLLYFQGFGEI